MDERRSFSAEELALAKSVDLTAVAASLGYTVKKIGRYHTLKEMDSALVDCPNAHNIAIDRCPI